MKKVQPLIRERGLGYFNHPETTIFVKKDQIKLTSYTGQKLLYLVTLSWKPFR